MTSIENPYQTPEAAHSGDLPDAPSSFGWESRDGVVQVEKLSLFPMIDPFSGASDETMSLQKVEVRYRPQWLMWSIPIGIILVLGSFNEARAWGAVMAAILLGAFLGWLVYKFAGLFFPAITLQLFFTKRTLAFRKWGARILGVLFLIFLPGSFLFALGPPSLRVIPNSAGLAWVLGSLLLSVIQRKLRCSRKNGDKYVIKGFHPAALAGLSASEGQPRP